MSRLPRPRHLRVITVVGVALVIAAIAVPSALGGTGIGAVFNLGRTNTVNAVSALTGSTSSRMLQVTNSGTGSALQLSTKTTVAPMKVNSSVKVTNLNADKLDGLSSEAFMAAAARPDADTLDGIDSAGFIQPNGLILVSSYGPWSSFSSTDPVEQIRFSNVLYLKRTAIGSQYWTVAGELPVALYGRATRLVGVELCYTSAADAYLEYLELNVPVHATGPATSANNVFGDSTDRMDSACRVYTPPAPVALATDNVVNLYASVKYTAAGGTFKIGRTTWILDASSDPAVTPSAITAHPTVLREGAHQPKGLPSTTAP